MGDDAPSPSASPASSSSAGASPALSSPRSKRRRVDRYALGFEFAPRLAPYEVPPPRPPEWTEGATFALLEAWGERFLRSGGRGIRAEEWLEVARIATAAAERPCSESQCRNRIDTLRKYFRKEKERARLAARRSRVYRSKWAYYDKMMSILCPPTPLPPLLDPIVKRRRDTHPMRRQSWGLDAPESMLGGGVDTGSGDPGLDAELDEPQKNEAVVGTQNGFTVLTESIQKFAEVFERMESSKRQHMTELEEMRRDFQRDLDVKWREILDKAQAEIACLGDEDDEDNEVDGNGNNMLEGSGDEEQNNCSAMDASP